MASTETIPAAVHAAADELPFVDIGDGSMLKVIQVKVREGLWVVENIFQPAFISPTHKHTGCVYGFTTSGAWKYQEYDYVNRTGSFLYEPAGSLHTLVCLEKDTHAWFVVYGANIEYDAGGTSPVSATQPRCSTDTTPSARRRDIRGPNVVTD